MSAVACGLRKNLGHLIVSRLGKFFIPLTHGLKLLRFDQGDEFINIWLENIARFGRRGGNGDDDLFRILLPEGLYGGADSGSRCNAVIHQNDDLVLDFRRSRMTAISNLTPSQFFHLRCHNIVYGFAGNVQSAQDSLIHHTNASTRNRTHGELLPSGHAKFTDNHHVQWRVQSPCDFPCHRNTPSGQPKDQYIFTIGIFRQCLPEHAAGFHPVLK